MFDARSLIRIGDHVAFVVAKPSRHVWRLCRIKPIGRNSLTRFRYLVNPA
jgi:hypothetical protein